MRWCRQRFPISQAILNLREIKPVPLESLVQLNAPSDFEIVGRLSDAEMDQAT